ncbi:MAG: membrane protein insertase YidC, partial [Planctomycetota bacterium]
QSADQSCFCTVMWLQDLMVWLLHNIYLLVRNYGVAIMILVLLVRGLLHPLAVWQQKNMFRMQESMARIQPKMEALKERYANDKVKLQQETMKLWSDEGVNPMASVFSMLPMLIQMPILIALWSALNTDVSLRHEPFDGWWIRDLSAPDALVTFAQPLVIPFLEWHIYSLNLLPLLMGVSMLLQQKYMPKPRPAVSPTAHRPKRPGAMTPEQTMRQQQIMIGMMSVLFPIMLYNQPSGLNLYWMSSNIVGIFESLRIRKQIHEERERRAREGPPQPRLPGPVARFFRRLAAQAEELQKKADELAREEGRKGKKRS